MPRPPPSLGRQRRLYNRPPPSGAIKRAPFPPGPDLYDEVTFAPHVCRDDAKLAYRLWSLPDRELGATMHGQARFLDPVSAEDRQAMPMHVLAKNVYDHLMRDNLLPPTDEEWEVKWQATGLDQMSWDFGEILDDLRGDNTKVIRVHGHDVLTSTYWTVAHLREELERRGVAARNMNSRELRECLYYHERYSFLRRSDLSHWGITRDTDRKYTVRLEDRDNKRYGCLEMYTCAVILSPYNPTYWLSRAYCHYQQAFYDLAIGDAYRAQLLYEVLFDPLLRNRQPKLYTTIWHAIEEHIRVGAARNDGLYREASNLLRKGNGVNSFIPTLRKAAQNIINLSLLALQSWNDHEIMENYLRQKAVMPERDSEPFKNRLLIAKDHSLREIRQTKKVPGPFLFHETNSGSIPGGRKYPFELNDKSRYEDEFTERLSSYLFARNQQPLWPACKIDRRMFRGETAATNDQHQRPGLGVFAAQDIPAQDVIYAEEPSIRGHLNPSRLVRGRPPADYISLRCENCHKDIPNNTYERYMRQRDQLAQGNHRDGCKCVNASVPVYYCAAQNQADGQLSCAQIARSLYHFGACGKDWRWLHDAMRTCASIYSTNERFHFSHSNEDHGTLLSLLLREVFDITLHRREEAPHIMAHEIDELLVLEDHHDWDSRSFPFTLAANIQVPFDILMQLGVDIFRDLSFDTWVIQTVLRKLLVHAVPWDPSLRGDGRPYRTNGLPSAEIQYELTEDHPRFDDYDPSFRDLYLFPGFSMFNHACGDQSNAAWAYDTQVPNRVIIWATKDIREDEEIVLSYLQPPNPPVRSLTRVLGNPCECAAPHVDDGTYANREHPPIPRRIVRPENPNPDPEAATPDRKAPSPNRTPPPNRGITARRKALRVQDMIDGAASDERRSEDPIPQLDGAGAEPAKGRPKRQVKRKLSRSISLPHPGGPAAKRKAAKR